MKELITQSEFARRKGVPRQSVYQWVKAGKLDDCMVGKKIIAEKALAVIDSRIDQIAQKKIEKRWAKESFSSEDKRQLKRAGLNQDTALAEGQRVKVVCEAALKQIELQERRGEVVLLAEVKKQATECAMLAKSQLLSLPDRLSAILATVDDPLEVKKIIKSEINLICMAISAGKWVDNEVGYYSTKRAQSSQDKPGSA